MNMYEHVRMRRAAVVFFCFVFCFLFLILRRMGKNKVCLRHNIQGWLWFVTVYRLPIRLPAKSVMSEGEKIEKGGSVTVYRLPIRLPAKSALTWPVV